LIFSFIQLITVDNTDDTGEADFLHGIDEFLTPLKTHYLTRIAAVITDASNNSQK